MAWQPPLAVAHLLLLAFATLAQDIASPHRTPTPDGGITAFVTSVSGNLITLMNGAITIDATDAIIANRTGLAQIGAVQPGAQIVVTISNPGAPPRTVLPASHILILEAPAGSLNGPVQSIDVKGNALTIFGARVLVTPKTKIVSFRTSEKITLADVEEGDIVAIQTLSDGAGLSAETLHVVPPAWTVVAGSLKSVSSTSWAITTRNGEEIAVTVNARTIIDRSIAIGDVVDVVGHSDSAGRITAARIASSNPRHEQPVAQTPLSGVVKSIAPDSWVITTRDGNEVTVAVNHATIINPTIKLGDAVRIAVSADSPERPVAVAIGREVSIAP
jgi:hypothetical protein